MVGAGGAGAGTDAGDEDDGWSSHIEQAKQTFDSIISGKTISVRPRTIFSVFWPLRHPPALRRLQCAPTRVRAAVTLPLAFRLRDVAARSGRSFLSLFNHADVIEAVRAEFSGEPYWQRVLEYAHLLRESLGVAALPAAVIADKIGSELISALTIRAASLRIDEVTAPPICPRNKSED